MTNSETGTMMTLTEHSTDLQVTLSADAGSLIRSLTSAHQALVSTAANLRSARRARLHAIKATYRRKHR